jgi:MSHA biogenesis protein MshO
MRPCHFVHSVYGRLRSRGTGVTIVELVVVIALLAIISAVGALAIRGPLQSYADTTRRAEMTDLADTALRRMGRDLRGALPNSIRVISGATSYLEFFPVRTAGRYRAEGTALFNPLDFNSADTSFNIIGTPSADAGQVIVPNSDILVVRNDTSATTDVRSNAYTYNQSGAGFNCNPPPSDLNCNTSLITAAPAASGAPNEFTLTFGSRRFNFDATAGRGFGSSGNRFYVVTSPVTYVCAPNNLPDANGDSPGTLRRVTGYAVTLAQPTPAGGDLVAGNVSACSISYAANISGYTGLVVLRLSLTRGNETVSLYHEVHVNNAP